jgi:hypothetical protein
MTSRGRLAVVGLVLIPLAVEVARASAEQETSGEPEPIPPATVQPPSVQELRGAIHAAGGFIVRATGPDGRFVYQTSLDPAVEPEPRYNILRHAGTIYSLGMYYRWEPKEETRRAMELASRYLRDCCVDKVPGHEGLLAVWSPPDIVLTGKPLQAKLGGSGLGLVALVGMAGVGTGSTPVAELPALARFLTFMQKPDGSFYSKYFPGQGRDDSWTSLYYPGEAALGLVMLAEQDGSKGWLEAASRALGYLATSREGQSTLPADHWALLATERLLQLDDLDSLGVSRRQLVDHAVRICRSIMELRPGGYGASTAGGALTPDGRTTPTATRLEGLLAAWTFLPPDETGLRQGMERAIHEGIAFLIGAQVRTGDLDGAIPRAIGPIIQAGPRRTPQVDPRASEVRIDYVQHALSAMIRYLEVFGGSGDAQQ